MSPPFGRMVALRYRDFRFLWFGEMVSTAGMQMQLFAINWHVFELLRGGTFTLNLMGYAIELGAEAFGLGMLGLARVFPVLLFALAGGLLADRYDRRRVMIAMRLLAAIVALTLTALTFAGQISVGMIYLLTALGAAAIALDYPARQSIEANLVVARHLSNAISLNMLVTKIATIAAPALGGLLLAQFNIGLVYGISAVAFLSAALSIMGIRYRGAIVQGARISWRTLALGIRFTFRKRIIMGTMLLDFFATLLASSRTMLPIVAGEVLGLGAVGYGLLATAQPVGGLLGGLFLSLRGELKAAGHHFLDVRRRLWLGDGGVWHLDQLHSFLYRLRSNWRRRHRFQRDSRHDPPIDDAGQIARAYGLGQYDVFHDRSAAGRSARRLGGLNRGRAAGDIQRRIGGGAIGALGGLAFSFDQALQQRRRLETKTVALREDRL